MKRLQWTLGTSLVAVSVAQSAIIAHGVHKFEPDEHKQIYVRRGLENARLITMLNGLGLGMIALRNSKRPNLALLPMGMLLAGTGLFSGTIWYEAATKDLTFHGVIKFGGSASILGWLFMGML